MYLKILQLKAMNELSASEVQSQSVSEVRDTLPPVAKCAMHLMAVTANRCPFDHLTIGSRSVCVI